MKVQAATATKICPLSPGLVVDGTPITECTVRLLTRKDQAFIAYEKDADKRDAMFFISSIASLGSITDSTLVNVALDDLTVVDEMKIRSCIAQLQQEHLKIGETEELRYVAITNTSDIVSEPFAITGFDLEGKRQRTCVVRLLRRGEWKHIQTEIDPIKRADLTLLYSIVQIGDIMKVEQKHLDLLLEMDVQIINEQVEVLQEQHAPATKSADRDNA